MNVIQKASRDSEIVISPTDPRWSRLRDIIEDRSVMRGDFVLASGRKSDVLFQLRQATMFGEAQHLIAGIAIEFMRRHSLRCVGGLELGAVPLVAIIAYAGYLQNYPVSAFFVRKKPKEHGAKELFNGYIERDSEVLFVDDVTTTGGSILQAVDRVAKEFHCTVPWALSIVDREEGAREALSERGTKLVSIFRKSDFKV